jgi:hypothetical protein
MNFVLSIIVSLILMQGSFDRHLYTFHIGESVTVAWDSQLGVDHFELELWHYEQDVPVNIVGMDSIPGNQTSATFTMPRTGHYEIWLRACNLTECSIWVTSPIDGTVDNNNRGWWIYGFPAPIQSGGLE